MKVSLSWIKEYAAVNVDTDELVNKIGAQLGAVEEVVDLGEIYRGIHIVKVVECTPHPKADKLSLCKIDDGKKTEITRDDKGLVQVICGAPNVKAGMLTAWIPPGITVPASRKSEPFILEAKEIRGEISNGMLASPKELAISDNHDGIIEIEDGVEVGQAFADLYDLNDTIIDIENKMFTHRPDLFGQLGVAREVAGITGTQFTSPEWYLKTRDLNLTRGSSSLEVKNEIPDLVPRFMVQVINGVSIKPSSPKIQSYLTRVGLRPINNVVDLTNYFMMLTAQPMHAYDYDKLKAIDGKEKATIVVRRPTEGEELILLNGKSIKLNTSDILIASASKAIGLGGVMGGADTEVDNGTTNIIVECANFDMYAVRRMSMAHGVFTDAVARFNKGQSPLQNDKILAEMVSQVIDNAGGEAEAPIDVQSTLPRRAEVTLSTNFVNDRLGLELDVETMAQLLKNVEFEVKAGIDSLGVIAPFWRTDIAIAEDIVEEVGRLYGYDNLVLDLPRKSIQARPQNRMLSFKSKLRELLVRAGSSEVLTYSFTNEKLFDSVGQNKDSAYQLSNARSPELQYYRVSLLPSILERIHQNVKAGYQEFSLFEMNKVHVKGARDDSETELPAEFYRLAVVLVADDRFAKTKYSGAPYYYAKYYLNYLLQSLGIEYSVKPVAEAPSSVLVEQLKPFETIRAGLVEVDGVDIGIVGEPSSKARKSLKLPSYVSMIELDLSGLLNQEKGASYTRLSSFPFVEQDICFKVPSELIYQDLADLLNAELTSNLTNCQVALSPLDIFQRDDDKAHKQITLRLRVSSYDKTLTSVEVNETVNLLGKVAGERFKAEII